jgi:hypothetical protein
MEDHPFQFPAMAFFILVNKKYFLRFFRRKYCVDLLIPHSGVRKLARCFYNLITTCHFEAKREILIFIRNIRYLPLVDMTTYGIG